MKNRYSLTEVQLRVMYGLALKTGHRATVGRGHEFKCNRITARALQELGLVETDAGYATGKEPPFFAIELTADGRELMMHPEKFLARTNRDAPVGGDARDPAAEVAGWVAPAPSP